MQYQIMAIERDKLAEYLAEVKKWDKTAGDPRAYACRALIEYLEPEVIQMLFDKATADRNGPESGSSTPDRLCYIIDGEKAYGA
jgi:hypothetical protein